jgi:hypothetical protein
MNSPDESRKHTRGSVNVNEQVTERWLSVVEFSALYGTTRETARRWCRQGRVKCIRIPPRPHARILILDPKWPQVDAVTSDDASEWIAVLKQRDLAALLGISARAVRYKEARGEVRYKIVGGRKRYSISEARRLLAERALGRKPRSRQEAKFGMLRWAFRNFNRNEGASTQFCGLNHPNCLISASNAQLR